MLAPSLLLSTVILLGNPMIPAVLVGVELAVTCSAPARRLRDMRHSRRTCHGVFAARPLPRARVCPAISRFPVRQPQGDDRHARRLDVFERTKRPLRLRPGAPHDRSQRFQRAGNRRGRRGRHHPARERHRRVRLRAREHEFRDTAVSSTISGFRLRRQPGCRK